MLRKGYKKGFTLVELLVVIAIIAIIAAVAVPVTISQIDKAKISTAKNEAVGAVGAAQDAVAIVAIDNDTTTIENFVKEFSSMFKDPQQVTMMYFAPIKNADPTPKVIGTKIVAITKLAVDNNAVDYKAYTPDKSVKENTPYYLSIERDSSIVISDNGITGTEEGFSIAYDKSGAEWKVTKYPTAKAGKIPAVHA